MRLRRPRWLTATTLRGHGRPDTRAGKCTTLRTAIQAPGDSERGAVGGRLHALVGRPTAGSMPSFQNAAYASPRGGCCMTTSGELLTNRYGRYGPLTVRMDSQARHAVLSPQNRIAEDPCRPTARASAAGVLRPTTQQARRDTLTATSLAGYH